MRWKRRWRDSSICPVNAGLALGSGTSHSLPMSSDALSPSPRRWIGPAIITAFIAVAVVIGATPRGPKGNFIQSSEFQMVMDRTTGGQIEPLPGRLSVTAAATFRAGDGRWCRQYRLTGTIEGTGIVCRSDGEWRSVARSDSSDSTGALTAERQRLGAGADLSASDEAALIADDWRGR